MTPSRSSAPLRIPIPLRVPELGPSLGQLVVRRRRAALWLPLDDLREQLATAIIELAGDARGAEAREDRDSVLDALERRAWLGAWERASRGVGERVAAALDARLDFEARRVRMGRWRRRHLKVSAVERRALAGRMATCGAGFVAALDALDQAAAQVREANVLDRAALARWQEALRAAARRLEAAWLALEDAVGDEDRRWTPLLEEVRRWRPPLWRLFALWVPVAALLVWLGLLWGGYLPAPAWLADRLGF
jgi:hypothetical protein